MKITINPKNLFPDDTWQKFHKVRAIIENNGMYAISTEDGKCIFPGGKCKIDENKLDAIIRELKEETGIDFLSSELQEVLELETIYDDFFDYRSQSEKPRHTITTYFYVKTNKNIDHDNMNLTDGEMKLNFKSFFVNEEELYRLINTDHSAMVNGKFFDEENKIVLQKILKKEKSR